jgi:flavin reductase (DIM6/NTAB) family NADH-FMN oxidoreductase RutF
MSSNENQEFRDCLGRFATGVTVVTCLGSKGPCGITANSFSSVSLEPPLVLWNIAKVTNSLQAYLDAERFAINVLGAEQQHLADHFAQSDHTVFNGIGYDTAPDGVPLLPGAVAYFECRTHQTYDCGDHHIIIGEVEKFSSNDNEPLLFHNSRYCRLGGRSIG